VRGTNDHLAIGIGGTRQAVLAAAALRCLGGELQAQLWPTRRDEIAQAKEQGIVSHLMAIIPDSFIDALAKGDLLQVLLVSILTGFAIALMGKPGEPILSSEVAISPDGSQAAMVRNGDIWVLEFARNSSSRLTSDPAAELAPIWSPDGKRVVFSSARVGAEGLSVKAANGATPEEQVLKSSGSVTPTSWSRDGKFLLYTSIDSKTKTDIWMMPAPGSSSSSDGDKPKPFLQTADSEGQAQFSPDGKWVVYASTESGTGEIYVRSFPDAGNKVKISTGGGVEPCWSADGKEIFYRNNRQVMAVPVTAGSIIHPGSPKVLFEVTLRGAGAMERHPNWIVSPDGKRFLAQVTGEANNSEPITVLLNWQAGLKR